MIHWKSAGLEFVAWLRLFSCQTPEQNKDFFPARFQNKSAGLEFVAWLRLFSRTKHKRAFFAEMGVPFFLHISFTRNEGGLFLEKQETPIRFGITDKCFPGDM